VFTAPPYLLPSTIYTLPLFPAHAEDPIDPGVRKNSKKFERGNIIKLEVRRSLKEFGKGDLIRSEFYKIDKRSFARGGLIKSGYL